MSGTSKDKDQGEKPAKVTQTVTTGGALAGDPAFEEAAQEAAEARVKKSYGDGDCELTLAHPLSAEISYQLGLGAQELPVRTTVKVSRGRARQLINAGAVTVDPEDRTAVAKALGIDANDPAAHRFTTVRSGAVIPGA